MEDVKKFESGFSGFDADGKYIKVAFSKSAKSEEFRAVWNHTLALMKKYGSSKWMINEAKLSVMPEDRNWHQNDWFAQSITVQPLDEKHPRYIALIMSENFFLEFSTKKFIEATSVPGFIVNVFPTEEKATYWLASQ